MYVHELGELTFGSLYKFSMVGGYTENLKNHRTVKIGGRALARLWALPRDNTVHGFIILLFDLCTNTSILSTHYWCTIITLAYTKLNIYMQNWMFICKSESVLRIYSKRELASSSCCTTPRKHSRTIPLWTYLNTMHNCSCLLISFVSVLIYLEYDDLTMMHYAVLRPNVSLEHHCALTSETLVT